MGEVFRARDTRLGREVAVKVLPGGAQPPQHRRILAIGPILLSSDGQSYIYSYRRQLDDLYLVEGLR